MIAVDCFLKTTTPLEYRITVTRKRLNVSIIITWFLSFAIGVGFVFGLALTDWESALNYRTSLLNDSTTNDGSIVASYENNVSAVDFANVTLESYDSELEFSLCGVLEFKSFDYKLFLTGLCSLLCTTLMITLYCCICCRVRGQQRSTERHTGVQRSSRKLIITTLLIVGSFLLAWAPISWILLVVIFIISIESPLRAARVLLTSAHVLQVLNATLDALIYAIRLEEIRQRYRIVFNKLKCGFLRNHTQEVSRTSSTVV